MEKTATLDGWSILAIFWVVLLTYSSAERQYFPQNTNATWIDARSHCQACFKELLTVTSENAQVVVQDLTSEYWIGLRKRPVNATMNSTVHSFNDTTTFWSGWADGDPLTFQNWYPGYPVFKSPFPRRDCCSCSCTCPAPPTTPPVTTWFTNNVTTYNVTTYNVTTYNVTTYNSTENTTGSVENSTAPIYSTTNKWSSSFTTTAPFTNLPLQSECDRSPMLFPDVLDPDEGYIEDPCVAMLSFGAWVERECWERRPFLCYDDRFYGQVNVSEITSTSASLTWDRGPGNITHYRVEVKGPNNTSNINQIELTYDIHSLIAGTKYSVQVFPVKCGRDLNPENATFYTVPSHVSDLQVVNQTEKCVWLRWSKPSSHADLYIMKTNVSTQDITETEINVCDLTSGSLHNFSVSAAVKDKSQISDEATISAYTKPGKVINLHTENVDDTSLLLKWSRPNGGSTSFWVTYFWDNGTFNASEIYLVTQTEKNMTGFPSATKITLSVTALVNGSLSGDTETVVNYTAPTSIANLTLKKTASTVSATWTYPEGSPFFKVELYLNDTTKPIDYKTDIQDKNTTFEGLNTATNYTVYVYSVSGNSTSKPVTMSIFTSPLPPTDVKLDSKNKTNLTFTWKPPVNLTTANYLVKLSSSFWGQHFVDSTNKTTHTFYNLTAGTNYTFTVQTIAASKEDLSRAEGENAFTDANITEIILSMMCSSTISLHCDTTETRMIAFNQLNLKFTNLLDKNVNWTLMEGGANTGA